MNETKKMTSIAGKINRSWTRKLIGNFMLLDILILILAVGGWCVYMEMELVEEWKLFRISQRGFHFDNLPFPQALSTAIYKFSGVQGNFYSVDAGPFFVLVSRLMMVLVAVELIIIIGQIVSGKKKARKTLAPLYEMAMTAHRLTQDRIDEVKVHNLEDAISKISPTKPDARLHTGDRDLQTLEHSINRLLDRMRESYRQQSRFVSDASHELRTPIAVIQGYANMLDRWGKKDEKVLDESISAIKGEAEHMKTLVEQLLFLARGDSGRMTLTFETFSLSQMMKEVYDESVMINPKHQWSLKNESEIYVKGDVSMLKQAARILVDNAAKYTPEGELIVLSSRLNSKGEPAFEVQDHGIGIGADDIPHVFERFYRSDPARGRQTGGTGLGLSIANWIVDRHGGYFTVLSREGLGTRITVSLPQDPVKSMEENKAQ